MVEDRVTRALARITLMKDRRSRESVRSEIFVKTYLTSVARSSALPPEYAQTRNLRDSRAGILHDQYAVNARRFQTLAEIGQPTTKARTIVPGVRSNTSSIRKSGWFA